MGRRACLAALLASAFCLGAAPASRLAGVGNPVASLELLVPKASDEAFLRDLNDFANLNHLDLTGEPADLKVNDRPVLVAWFTRADGLALLVTDALAPERMQAFFYLGNGGFPPSQLPGVMLGYRRQMSGYRNYAAP